MATGIRYLVISQVEKSRSRRAPAGLVAAGDEIGAARAQSVGDAAEVAGADRAGSSSASASSGEMLK